MRALRYLITFTAVVSLVLTGLSLAWWQRSYHRMDSVICRPMANANGVSLFQFSAKSGKLVFSHIWIPQGGPAVKMNGPMATWTSAAVDPISGYCSSAVPALEWKSFARKNQPVQYGSRTGNEFVIVLPLWPAPILFVLLPMTWFFWHRRRMQPPFEPAVPKNAYAWG